MNFLKNERRFDLLYDGNPFEQCEYTTEQTVNGNTVTTVYTFSDGLQITNEAKRNDSFGTYEWVNFFKNTSNTPTKVISRLYDAVFIMPLEKDILPASAAYLPDKDKFTKLYSISGSGWVPNEFFCDEHLVAGGGLNIHLRDGQTRRVTAAAGVSSDKDGAPFLNLHKQNKGFIAAIGWTGQWFYEVTRGENEVSFKSGIEDVEFFLEPNESFRTSSVVIMPYEGDVRSSQNRWKRLVSQEYSLIGKDGRDDHGPLSAGIWGGMHTDAVLERIKTIRDNALPYEYIWMDAGWYGIDTKPTLNDAEGDWHTHTGDWRVSPLVHPNALRDVSEEVHNAGMKFLLWFEPERVIASTPNCLAHPEYFLPNGEGQMLLDLGNDEARSFYFEELSSLIEQIGIDCYRQDFNTSPLETWRKNDAESRRGITEIKHINGLYALWDDLLERFPHLLIDNCASGGRRIDIETLRRSIPLWRSDLQCPANYDITSTQMQHLGYSNWLPYSGTGSGRIYDTYRIRSAYSPALTTNYTFAQNDTFGDDPEKLEWLKERLEEYLKVRPYLSEDFYPLTAPSYDPYAWSAAQFDRPEQKDGIIQVFRRELSPYDTAVFKIKVTDETAVYTFTDADTNETFKVIGKKLANEGLRIDMPNKRSSKLLFYSAN